MNFEDYESLPTQNFVTHMTAGAIAGVMEHCIMYPLDSVKVSAARRSCPNLVALTASCRLPYYATHLPLEGYVKTSQSSVSFHNLLICNIHVELAASLAQQQTLAEPTLLHTVGIGQTDCLLFSDLALMCTPLAAFNLVHLNGNAMPIQTIGMLVI